MRINNQKIIWCLWNQGWHKAPLVSSLCAQSWVKHNPDYLLIQLDQHTLKKYIDLHKVINNFQTKTIDQVALSDIIRVSLLYEYGGIWIDSTVLCLKPLSKWIENDLSRTGFLCYQKERKNRLISSWFLASSCPHHPIVKEWYNSIQYYWSVRQKKDTYFWVHNILHNIIRDNYLLKQQFDRMPYLSSSISYLGGPHAFVPYHIRLTGIINDQLKTFIDSGYNNNNILKLTRHFNQRRIYDTNTTINYILKKEKLL